MRFIKNFEMYYRDKLKMLQKGVDFSVNDGTRNIPESYIIFRYRTFSFIDDEYYDYLILGKIKSLPYEEDSNTFVKIDVIDYFSFSPHFFNKKIFNVDIMRPVKQDNSLKQIKIDFENEKEMWKIKNSANKYNI